MLLDQSLVLLAELMIMGLISLMVTMLELTGVLTHGYYFYAFEVRAHQLLVIGVM